jgi:hypothetical protein
VLVVSYVDTRTKKFVLLYKWSRDPRLFRVEAWVGSFGLEWEQGLAHLHATFKRAAHVH